MLKPKKKILKQFRYFEFSIKILEVVLFGGFYLCFKTNISFKRIRLVSKLSRFWKSPGVRWKILDRRPSAARLTAALFSERANIWDWYYCKYLLMCFLLTFKTYNMLAKYTKAYTLGSPEMQMFMQSILNTAVILYSQKLTFPLSSEVCCLLKYNYFTLKISGFNLNLSGNSSFWLPLPIFCGIILSYSSLHSATYYFFF